MCYGRSTMYTTYSKPHTCSAPTRDWYLGFSRKKIWHDTSRHSPITPQDHLPCRKRCQQPSKSYNFSRFSRSRHTNFVWFWRVGEKCKLRKPPCYFCVLTRDTSKSYKDCMISHNPQYALLPGISRQLWPVKWMDASGTCLLHQSIFSQFTCVVIINLLIN